MQVKIWEGGATGPCPPTTKPQHIWTQWLAFGAVV